jgi:hypothetical protein
MSVFIIFTLGYLLGGMTSLLILGLTTAARRADSSHPISMPHVQAEETIAAWRRER